MNHTVQPDTIYLGAKELVDCLKITGNNQKSKVTQTTNNYTHNRALMRLNTPYYTA